MRIILQTVACLVLFSSPSFSQAIKWNTSPHTGFVFQITNQEAQKLLTTSTPDVIFRGLLRNLIDTFDIRKGWVKKPSQGHFILASIDENKLHCEYTSVFPYQVFLLKEYDALSLQVLDLDGNVRGDANVKFKLTKLRIDPDSKTYRIENAWVAGDNKIVTVELNGFRSIFNIEKHEVPIDHWNYGEEDGPSFYSYMISDKNKYKPNEKVRFKSYALNQSRIPIHRDLDVWLNNRGRSTKVAKVSPHRPGSFSGEFVLHDSLKLTLDRNYNLQLREKNGRVVANCNFNYEDYELNGNKLEVKLATDKQFHPQKNELSILATDVNGLILKDAKATILVKSQTIRETFQPITVLRDTLLFTQVDLDPKEPTLVDIASALFQKTNSTYQVTVWVRDSQNQVVERTVGAIHYYSAYELITRFSNDSIVYELLKNGSRMNNISMHLRHNDDRKAMDITLPYKEKINPAFSSVSLTGDFVSRQIAMNTLIPQLEINGGIERDSFKIKLDNPQQLEVSWYIYQGSQLVQKGFGKELDFKIGIVDRTQTLYVELLYSFGGTEHSKRKDYEFRESYLNVSLDVPTRAYPGQKTDATITVVDQLGEPVNGVDLTAMAVTGKLNYYLPDLPYYGNASTPRPRRAHYTKSEINKRVVDLELDYATWAPRAGLDTMKYYQFTYPAPKTFVYSSRINDSTQFAPYVMQKGLAKKIYVIEVDRKPVYYSWVDQPKQYSFYAPHKKKCEISVRLFDRVIVFDSIQFAHRKKTILSIDLDHLPANVRVYSLYNYPKRKKDRLRSFPSFTKTEIDRHLGYVSYFNRIQGDAYLQSATEFTPLFNGRDYSSKERITVGPITPGRQVFSGPNGLKTAYQHTSGFTYSFEGNIVYKLNAEKLIPERLYDESYKPMRTINDLATTKKVFLESGYVDNRWHARSVNLVDPSLHLSVLLPEEKAASGFASILFENCVTKKIISPCQTSADMNFNTIPRGCHNLIALYNNGTFLKIDSVNLDSHSSALVDLSQSPLKSADSISRKWLRTFWLGCRGTTEARVVSMRRSFAVHGNIKGAVYDDQNMPIPGVNIVIKGSVDGTVTDEDGQFALDAHESMVTIVVSFIGYATQELEVQAGSEVSIYLQPDVTQLQEVVVTAYGMSSEKRTMSYALMGVVAGVDITRPDKDVMESRVEEKRQAEQRLYSELLTLNTIRSHFNDVGFWEPRLYTDKAGKSKFAITFPDDITRWEATVYAMNRHLQTGTARKSIKSYKPIMAELLTPQFLTQGDSAFFLGKVSNYTEDKAIKGRVKWNGTSTGFEKDIQFSEFNVDRLLVNAVSTDSVTTRYLFTRDDGYVDGEERKVPVVEHGIVRADGTLSILRNHETANIKALPKQNITVEILDNPIDIYAEEAKYLLNYKYDCNEQLASKLLGLLNYRLLARYEGKVFNYDKDVNKIIGRLLKNQNEEFLWSWWDVSPRTSYWISAHILRALKAANDAGYKVALDIDNISRKAEYNFLHITDYSLSDADLLQALASWNASINYGKYVAKLDTLIERTEHSMHKVNRNYRYPYSLLKYKLLLLEVRQLAKLFYQRDSLLRYQKKGIMGEVFFSDNKTPSYWYDDQLTTNAIAYRILKKDTSLRGFVEPMQMYFLSHRKDGAWNTYHSSNVLMNVLPDLISDRGPKALETKIALRGKINTANVKLPYKVELHPQEELQIKKESGLPVYLMQYQWDRVTTAKTGVDGFEIKTSLGNNQVLQGGKPVSLNVEVNVKREVSAEFVMIEVPIPAGCSYADKSQRYSGGVETHREYFKEKTVIFCERMKSGKYVFQVNLLPRFTGRFMINPAQVSLMYVPVVNANTELKKIRID